MDNQKKIYFIENMRILGFISVILIHITAEYVFLLRKDSIQSFLIFFINNSAKFAVPLFVFISGFVLSYSY